MDEFDLRVADEGKQYTDEIRTRMDNFLREEDCLAMTASADADQADIAPSSARSVSPPPPR